MFLIVCLLCRSAYGRGYYTTGFEIRSCNSIIILLMNDENRVSFSLYHNESLRVNVYGRDTRDSSS